MKLTKKFLLENLNENIPTNNTDNDYFDQEYKNSVDRQTTENAQFQKVESAYTRYILDTLNKKPNPNTNIFKPIEDELHKWAKNKSDDELRNFDMRYVVITKVINKNLDSQLK